MNFKITNPKHSQQNRNADCRGGSVRLTSSGSPRDQKWSSLQQGNLALPQTVTKMNEKHQVNKKIVTQEVLKSFLFSMHLQVRLAMNKGPLYTVVRDFPCGRAYTKRVGIFSLLLSLLPIYTSSALIIESSFEKWAESSRGGTSRKCSRLLE